MTAPSDPPKHPPADRFCDLVMKGGITSGVVYPNAIDRLSHTYRFKNIGGTSAGAIAAAVTAAAEFQRRRTGSRAGFELLAELPGELKKEVSPGRRKLLSLFQPQPGSHRLFSVLVTALNSQGTGGRLLSIVLGALRAYWLATLLALAGAAAARYFGADWLAVALTLLFLLLGLVGAWVYVDLTRRVVANGFGLCTGLQVHGSEAALTPWLHDLIQRAAGRSACDAPLTFGELWDAPGFPVPPFTVPPGATRKSINLEMFSTNLSHGRPYIFPLADDAPGPTRFRVRERLYFRSEEMERYLPEEVCRWLHDHGRAYRVEPDREGRDPSLADAAELGLLEIPAPRDFPVLLAARMSLSFPLLFAAVPLWAIDHDHEGVAPFRRCWFSDGGISSNFPMHLFDGLVPAWPTFGINLEPEIKGRGEIFLPADYASGYGERWNNFDDANPNGAARFGGFFSAIVGTMQNWNDNALSRMPGVRDRIARVRLSPKEGGLNLNMEAQVIVDVARRGEAAAGQILARFGDAAANPPAGRSNMSGWDEQRWVRLGVLLKLIEERAPGVLAALDPQLPHATDFDTLIQRASAAATTQAPAGYEAPLTPAQVDALRAVLKALGVLVGTMAQPACKTDFKPIPKPELRLRPPL